jgi:hypothetical protein
MAGMVAGNPVWLAADRIRARPAGQDGRKERVSVRSVRRELGKGSFSDIARELAVWRDTEDYRPAIEEANLPEAFERRLTVIGRELLELARVEAARAKLADFAESERRRSAERDVLDEALDRVDLLEEQVAALQAELNRRPAAGAGGGQAATAEEAPAAQKNWNGSAFADMAQDTMLAKRADAFWDQVRAAVEDVVRQRGPLAVHPLFKSLPDRLKRDGERAGFPLTEGWLRYHLLRLVEDGRGLKLDGHRFGLNEAVLGVDDEVTPETSAGDEAAAMGRRRFWRRFIHEVHELLAQEGPMMAEEILDRMGTDWVGATGQFQKVTAGRLRYKLKGRILEGRPFEELPDGRFAAIAGETPWDGRSAMPSARNG